MILSKEECGKGGGLVWFFLFGHFFGSEILFLSPRVFDEIFLRRRVCNLYKLDEQVELRFGRLGFLVSG